MINLFHTLSETEFRVIFLSTFLRTFKLDSVIDDVIDILHDTQIKSFESDTNISESERKKEYPISEVFTTNYFTSSNTRRGSRDINMDGFLAVCNKIFDALANKIGGFYSLSIKDSTVVCLDLTIPNIDFNGVTITDDNYGLYRIHNDYLNMTEERRRDAFITHEDSYSPLYSTTYSSGDLIFHFYISAGGNPTSSINQLLASMFDYNSVRNIILKKINN